MRTKNTIDLSIPLWYKYKKFENFIWNKFKFEMFQHGECIIYTIEVTDRLPEIVEYWLEVTRKEKKPRNGPKATYTGRKTRGIIKRV